MPKKKPQLQVTDLRKLPRDERPDPTSGQSGPPLNLKWEEFNEDEQNILKTLHVDGRAELPIAVIAKGRGLTPLKVRNGLRRPVRASWIEAVRRGQYRLTSSAAKKMPFPALPAPPKPAKAAKPVKAAKAPKPARAAAKSTRAPKTIRAEAAAPPSPPVAGQVNIDELRAEVKRSLPGDASPMLLDSGLVAAVASRVGASDSKISKLTGLSRGFVIPRLKRLKAHGLVTNTASVDYSSLARIAEGTPPSA